MFPPNLYARVPPFAVCIGTRDRGCSAHPVFPAPSDWRGREVDSKPRAISAARRRNCIHRHCEPTGRANAHPMTGSAKQSILSLRGTMDCFASLAMTVSEFPCTRGGVTPSLWLKMERAMRTHRNPAHRTHLRRTFPALRRNQLHPAVERAAGLGSVGADRREQADAGGAQPRTPGWQLLDPRQSAR